MMSIAIAQDNVETVYVDTDKPFRWVRSYEIDPFDDTVFRHSLIYYEAPELYKDPFGLLPTEYDYSKLTLFGIYRDQDPDNSSCTTFINVFVPAVGLSESQLKDTKLSFNFKRYKTITLDESLVKYSDPMDDLKFLNLEIERHNVWSGQAEGQPNGTTRLAYATDVKKILVAMIQSREMRVRVQFGDQYFNLSAPIPRGTKSKDEVDDEGWWIGRTYTLVHEFEEKWEWVQELCEDPAVDSTEGEEETED